MKLQRFFLTILPLLIAVIFLSTAGACFCIEYCRADTPGTYIFPVVFRLNFFISLIVSFIGLCGLSFIFRSSAALRGIFFMITLFGTIAGGYMISNFFSVNLLIYCAFILVTALVFSFPRNLLFSGAVIVFLVLFLFHPYLVQSVWGTGGRYFFTPAPDKIVLMILIMVFLAGVTASIRFLFEKILNAGATIDHLNEIGTTLTLFNHQLQDYVKKTGEETIKKDRMRFTSDLHDSCGYVFTNIIAISEAALSWSQPDTQRYREIFDTIQNEAKDGLKRTREILYMIRDSQDLELGIIDTIYKMKSILEETTDVKITIETGNIKYNYGPDINHILTRIVQEAFTNSMRHGEATCINITFWEQRNNLELTVRDNGKGSQKIVEGIGLAGMGERIRQVSGKLEVYSPEDGGFCLNVSIPLVQPDTNAVQGGSFDG
ncbi:MAG: sensor histidine kinase [Treponema sp.]|nr:sensor histidine kinase [Treponema sp.]